MRKYNLLIVLFLICDVVHSLAAQKSIIDDKEVHIAARNGDYGRIRQLAIKDRSWLKIQGAQGYTALHIAAAVGNSNMVALLLTLGASASAKDNAGLTPREVAEDNGFDSTARIFDLYFSESVWKGFKNSDFVELFQSRCRM